VAFDGRSRGVIAACVLVLTVAHLAADPQGEVPPELLDRIGRYVEDYYRRSRTIVGRETVRLQPLDAGLRPDGIARWLEFDLRIEWDGAGLQPTPPAMSRQLTRTSGHLENAREVPDCFDPHASSIEPLGMLLPVSREAFKFRMAGTRDDGRVALIDYTPRERGTPRVEWRGPCASIRLNGQTDGRIWAELVSGKVLRIEERLSKPFQFVVPENVHSHSGPVSQTIDRLETAIRYEAVKFRDPDETLMLPKSIRTLAIVYNGGIPRMLTLQSYDKYRRFMTGGRVVQ
jgi:hypothetical protein